MYILLHFKLQTYKIYYKTLYLAIFRFLNTHDESHIFQIFIAAYLWQIIKLVMERTEFFILKEQFFENINCTACGSCILLAFNTLDGVFKVAINTLKHGVYISFDPEKLARFEIEYFLLEKGLLNMRQLKMQ
jgi:hypothetical protein